MLQNGELLDNRYRIIELIGRGGMGKVYLAVNERINKTVAIKELSISDDRMNNFFSARFVPKRK